MRMAEKIVVGILIALLIFPISVLAISFKQETKQEDLQKAESYYKKQEISKNPHRKKDGGKYTIAYVDIDPYPASGEMLYYFVEELKQKGWISYKGKLPFDSENTDAKKLISYLAKKDLGDYLRFSDEANYYIAVDGKDSCKRSLQKQIEDKKIDLIFCMGTSPGEMVIKEMKVKDVPVMVYFSVDPVGAGLSKKEEYSGISNVWCHTSSEVYENQMQFYYKNALFKNIGMVYYSESVSMMSAYRKVAKKEGFQITEEKIQTLSNAKDKNQVEKYYQMLEKTFTKMAKNGKIDAFMLSTDIIKDENRISKLLDIFYREKIPVFVQNGEYYVKKGALMVVTASNAKMQAPFAVDAMAAILNGKEPDKVYQKFVPSPYLSINLETARKIGYEVKEELLLSAEKLYGSK